MRRVHGRVGVPAAPVVDPVALREWWSDLVQRRCGRREDAAAAFGAAFQTACNWFDGVGSPNAAHLMAALMMWPEEFGLEAAPPARPVSPGVI